jgi:hypothetical protein
MGAKLAKLIFGVVLVPLGVGICVHPVAGAFFNPGGKFGLPHTEQVSSQGMRLLGIFIAFFGIALLFSAFRSPKK